jgi:hypothetical protein
VNCRHHSRPPYIASLNALPRCVFPTISRESGVYRDEDFE